MNDFFAEQGGQDFITADQWRKHELPDELAQGAEEQFFATQRHAAADDHDIGSEQA